MDFVTEQTVARLHTERDGTFLLNTGDTRSAHDMRRVWSYSPFFAARGYQVGGYVPTLTDPTESALAAWIADILADGIHNTIGVWTDDGGAKHWDATAHFYDLDTALEVGQRHGEDYIWDWATGTGFEGS